MLCLRVLYVFLVDRRLQDTNIGQVTVALCIVQAITNDKAVRNLEAGVVQFDNFDTLPPLVQKCTDASVQLDLLSP